MIKRILSSLNKAEWFLFLLFFSFSLLLMNRTFRLDLNGNIEIATKAWSDFAATIPLIRSFSFGSNFPPQYPIFPGPPIRYHFIFYLFAGTLERIGLPINAALNLPSITGFTLLLITIYIISKNIFNNKSVGVLSTLFFLFNGSFGFLEFFKKHPLSVSSLRDILTNTAFSSFGPYDGNIVSAFWSLNIYTNQRHLAVSYAFLLIILYLLYRYGKKPEIFTFKKALFLGFVIGLFPFFHFAVFGMLGILLFVSFLVQPKIRLKILTTALFSLIIAIPQIMYMGKPQLKSEFLHIGYLIEDPGIKNFVSYWFLNLGLIAPLSILGFLFSDSQKKKLFIFFITLFLIGNTFQFSTEIAANHKFFNLFLIGMNMFAAYFLTIMWKNNTFAKLVIIITFPLLILTGIIDFFPIINDSHITTEDIPNNKTAAFIKESSPADSVFLNSSFLYDPASLAGRKIYMGWPYFSWSAGYDTFERDQLMKRMLNPDEIAEACRLYEKENIDFIEIKKPNSFNDTPVNYDFFEKYFTPIFTDKENNLIIYEVDNTCKNPL